MNDYEQTMEDCDHAYNVTAVAFDNAVDPDIQSNLEDAMVAIARAKRLAALRA